MQFLRDNSYIGAHFHRFSDSWNNRFDPVEVVSVGLFFFFNFVFLFLICMFLCLIVFLGKLVGETEALLALV